MNMILLEPMTNLGGLGEEVSVKGGYARNYLIPRGKAVRATADNRAHFETRRAELEAAARARLGEAEGRAAKLEDVSVTIGARASEEGKLYGSVGTAEIADALEFTGAEVTKAEIKMPEGVIRATGEYEVDVQLHSDLFATIKVIVVPE